MRQAIPFDRTTYVTMANYEAFVVGEVANRLKSSSMNGSELLSGVIQSLKRDGVTVPGILHTSSKVLMDYNVRKDGGPA